MMHWLTDLRCLLFGGICTVCLMACANPAVMSPDATPCMSAHNRFIGYENHTMLDRCTQLMWMTQDFRQLEGKAPARWPEALAWAGKMNQQRLGGYTDWRPATLGEYQAIYQPQSAKQSYRGKAVGYPEAFTDGGGEWYWVEQVADIGHGHIHQAYIYDFRTGKRTSRRVHSDNHPQVFHSTGSIRLVRGPVSVTTQ